MMEGAEDGWLGGGTNGNSLVDGISFVGKCRRQSRRCWGFNDEGEWPRLGCMVIRLRLVGSRVGIGSEGIR